MAAFEVIWAMIRFVCILLFLSSVWAAHARTIRLESSNTRVAVDSIAIEMNLPTGIVADPVSDDLYVAEAGGNRIVRIRNKIKTTFVGGDFEISPEGLPHHYRLTPEDAASWSEPGFRYPSGIGFARGNLLIVAEDGKGARLLAFDVASPSNASARVLRTPWQHGDYGYSSMTFDAEGRLYLTARKNIPSRTMPFGNVLMRDESALWWMMDYGPFADFAPLALDRTGRYIAIGEQRASDIVWYDTKRELPIGEMSDIFGLRHCAILADGTTVAIIERTNGTWSLVELNPLKSIIYEWLGDLGKVSCLYVHPRKNELYVSLLDEGRVIRIRRIDETPEESTVNKLDSLRMRFEEEKNYPPEHWPRFMQDFIGRLGIIKPVNSGDEVKFRPGVDKDQERHMTVEQFAEVLPLVAGKFKCIPPETGRTSVNPIVEISFLMLAPNSELFTRRINVESLSLLKVKRANGSVRTTNLLQNRLTLAANLDNKVSIATDQIMSDPLGHFIGNDPLHTTNRVRMAFTTLTVGPDYEIDLFGKEHHRSSLKVIYPGNRLVKYSLEPFDENANAGGESFLVANCKEVSYGWLPLLGNDFTESVVIGEGPSLHFRHAVNFNGVKELEFNLDKPVAHNITPRYERLDLAWPRRVIRNAGREWRENPF